MFNKLGMIVPRIIRDVVSRREARIAPLRQRSTDFFIVEFPKSGITWLSTLFTNAFLVEGGHTALATIASVRNYVPDLNTSNLVEAYTFMPSGLRFYKSHVPFNSRYIHTLYLVRHPFDVMKSFHRYKIELGRYDGSLEDFCNLGGCGFNAWRRHVHSWLKNGRDSNQRFLHLVRYEDLLTNPVTELRNIARNFGWALSKRSIEEAVRLSDRACMAKQEETYRSHNPNHSIQFIGSHRHAVQNDALRLGIEQDCAEELRLLGYY